MKGFFTHLVLLYLRFFSRLAEHLHHPTIVGITGSVGKSSTRNAVYAMLKDYVKTVSIEKGNSETGIPLGMLGFAPKDYSLFDWIRLLLLCPFGLWYLRGVQYLVVEMGVDNPYPPKNMEWLLTILQPSIAIFLNVHPVHTMQFETILPKREKKLEVILAHIAEEKGKIITKSGCRIGIYNRDDTRIVKVLDQFRQQPTVKQVKLFSFGKEKNNEVSYGAYQVSLTGTEFAFTLQNQTQRFSLSFPAIIVPEEYREVFATSILVGKAIGLSDEQIKRGLEKNFHLPKGRAQILKGIRDSIIIDSSYNASYASVSAFLDLAYRLKNQTKRPLVFLFGDMRELGDEAKIEHEKVASSILGKVDYLYCVGPLTKEYIIENQKFKSKHISFKEIQWFNNSYEAGIYLKHHVSEGAIILVKGSQNTIFLEEAIKPLLQNKRDEKYLCRQEEFWMRQKHKVYES